MGAAPRSKVLLALSPGGAPRLQRVLEGHDVTLVSTRKQAWALLERERFSMVIIGVHFDESQMFSLLADIRSHAMYRKVPILCVLAAPSQVLSDVAIQGLDHAVKAMTANGFLNLAHIADDGQGNARIRRIIDYLILIDGDLQHIARAAGDDALAPLVERRSANNG
jgi:PleD family two-component response regulator